MGMRNQDRVVQSGGRKSAASVSGCALPDSCAVLSATTDNESGISADNDSSVRTMTAGYRTTGSV